MLQRTDPSLEWERDRIRHRLERRRKSRQKWGLSIAVLLLALIGISAQPTIVARALVALAGFYYQFDDPIDPAAIASTGPSDSPVPTLRPDQLLSALSASFPGHRVRIEQTNQIEPQSYAPFAHQVDSNLFRSSWPQPMPEATSDQPWLWSEILRQKSPIGPPQDVWRDRPLRALPALLRGEGIDALARAQIFVASCLADGFSARIVFLSQDGQSWDQVGAEVFVPSLQRWVFVDPELNVRYELDGNHLSAADLQASWANIKQRVGINGPLPPSSLNSFQSLSIPKLTGIEILPVGPAGADDRQRRLASSPTSLLLENFEYVVFPARNNHLTLEYPPGHPVNLQRYGLLADHQTPASPAICANLLKRSPEALYPTIGGSRVDVCRLIPFRAERTFSLSLSTYTPNFSHFQTSLDGGPWQDAVGSQIEWTLRPTENVAEIRETFTFEARSVNRSGLIGPPARLRIMVEPLRDRLSRL